MPSEIRLGTLQENRLNAGLSVAQCAAKAGVNYRTMLRIEAGQPVRPENLKKVADLFDLKVTDLMPLETAA